MLVTATRLVTGSGSNVFFSGDGKSLLMLRGYFPEVHLDQVDVNIGSTMAVLASSVYATDIRLSPGQYSL